MLPDKFVHKNFIIVPVGTYLGREFKWRITKIEQELCILQEKRVFLFRNILNYATCAQYNKKDYTYNMNEQSNYLLLTG